jgi:hypothetical protein
MSEKKVKALAITGNKLVDGLISLFISFVIFGICLWVAKIYGSPAFWWQTFGGVLASVLVGVFFVALLFGFSLFSAGFLLVVDWWFRRKVFAAVAVEINKEVLTIILYIPTLLCLVYLVAKGILPWEQFLDFLKSFLLLILAAGAGYIIGKFSK